MTTCLFCRIINGEIPASKVYEDKNSIVFNDINPQAPVHMLAIPKKHYESVHDIKNSDMQIMANLFTAVNKAVELQGLEEKGYRLVVNSGKTANQTVPHIHIHILSGRDLTWPPG
jgi:histidine triad (HIT) family protein